MGKKLKEILGRFADDTLVKERVQKDHPVEVQEVPGEKGIFSAGDGEPSKRPGASAPAVKEEAEQIDELSKKTLGSYVKKASKQAAHAMAGAATSMGNNARQNATGHGTYNHVADAQKGYSHAAKRLKGVGKASDKLAKEEVEPLTELSKLKLQRYSRLATKDKSKDRTKGVALAQDKLKESEQINEVSKRLLQRYLRKAEASKGKKDRTKGQVLAQDRLDRGEYGK